jgi:hypothetical protein
MIARHATTLAVLVRAAPRRRVLAATGCAAVAVATTSMLAGQRASIAALQVSTVALAGAAVTLLQEPCTMLDALPTTRARRRALLLAFSLPLLALAWLALLAIAGVGGAQAGALTLQLAAVAGLALGLAGRGGDPARALVGVALAYGAARVLLGPELFPAGTEATRMAGAGGMWLGVACAGLALLVVSSR